MRWRLRRKTLLVWLLCLLNHIAMTYSNLLADAHSSDIPVYNVLVDTKSSRPMFLRHDTPKLCLNRDITAAHLVDNALGYTVPIMIQAS